MQKWQLHICTAQPSPFSACLRSQLLDTDIKVSGLHLLLLCTCACMCTRVRFFYADIKKMPLGKLSKMQIAKGFEVLEEIEAAMNQPRGSARLEELSSKFFTTVPHNFGRNRPPTINSKEIVEQKKEMLMVRWFLQMRLLHSER